MCIRDRCEKDWYRKSEAFCSMDINACYADLDNCKSVFPISALGGTVEIDFLCGTDDVCGEQLSPAKLQRAKDNLRDKYEWVGVLENMDDSLRLLQHLLPDMFGSMNATFWSTQHIAPDGGSPSKEVPPREATLAKMRQDEYLAAEYELYDYAKEVLDCKLRGCGLQSQGQSASASSFALEYR